LTTDVIVVRSTVPVGTTDRLKRESGKSIVFQPEYGPGETPDHHFNDRRRVNWIILGGDREDTVEVADLYKQAFSAELVIHQSDTPTAELTKYMENCFLALKVTFCNEFYDLAQQFGIDLQRASRAMAARSADRAQPHLRIAGRPRLRWQVPARRRLRPGPVGMHRRLRPQMMMAMIEANARFRRVGSEPALETAPSR
jgi:UDP-N-acetyl-D-mannosaminuronate dehydrogenase